MKRLGKIAVVLALVATLGLASACQRTVEVQTGTRIVDSSGRVISEDIKTLRVPPATAGAYRINTIVQPDETAGPEVAALYASAQTAIAAGNLKLAETKLDAVIALDPNYGNAKAQSDAIKAGKKVTPDTKPAKPSTPATSSKPPAKPPVDITSKLLAWMPDKLDGFVAVKPAVDPLSASRMYTPASGNRAKSLVIVAEQYRTSADAKRALTNDVKRRYAKNGSTSNINGHSVYFGTDGRDFAVVGFTSGAVMVALEASPDSGSPTTMKPLLEKALKQLP
jgi:hypothetical protein